MKIELKKLLLTIEGKKLFDNIDYVFEPGCFYVIKGESGCGKTTLLKCMASLAEVDGGDIDYSFDGSILELRRKVQYLPQMPVIFPGTVKENLLKPFSFKPYDKLAPGDEELSERLSSLFTQGVDLRKKAHKMSQGEKQRLALCRALMVEPEVLLCDEPTASLDEVSRKVVEEKVADFTRAKGKTTIFISHHEKLLVDRKVVVLTLANGSFEESQ